MREYVLYATKIGAADWEEEVIASDIKPFGSEAEFERVKGILASRGYDRVAVVDLRSGPDFVGAVSLLATEKEVTK